MFKHYESQRLKNQIEHGKQAVGVLLGWEKI